MLLMYHSASILFHRVAYSRIDDSVCLRSATAVTKMLSAFPAIDLTSDLCCVIFPTVSYGLLMTCTVWIAKFMTEGNKESLENVKCCLDAFDNLRGLSQTANRGRRIVTEYLQMKGIRLPSGDDEGGNGNVAPNDSRRPEEKGPMQSMMPSPRQSRIPMDSLLNSTGARKLHSETHPDLVIGPDPSMMLGTNAPLLGIDLGMWWDGTNLFDLAGLGGLVSDTPTLASSSSATPEQQQFRFPDSSPSLHNGQNGIVLNAFGGAAGPQHFQQHFHPQTGYGSVSSTSFAPAATTSYINYPATTMGQPQFAQMPSRARQEQHHIPQQSYPPTNSQWGYM
ncbi:hypothetical protein BC829DRAFT_406059, partial [Chytridium lagenaria]